MMLTYIAPLQDGRKIGCIAVEILSFPSKKSLVDNDGLFVGANSSFQKMITELAAVCGENACFEVLYTSTLDSSPRPEAVVRCFFLVRKYGNEESEIKQALEGCLCVLTTQLDILSYHYGQLTSLEAIRRAFPQDGVLNLCAIKKKGTNTSVVYNNLRYDCYYTSVVRQNKNRSFRELMAHLQKQPGAFVSFQLFATYLTNSEKIYMQRLSDVLAQLEGGVYFQNQIVRNPSASIPHTCYTYYLNHAEEKFFQYNILVGGKSIDARMICSSIISFLDSDKSTDTHVSVHEALCLLSQDFRFSLHFMSMPWNINHDLIYKYRNKQVIQAMQRDRYLFRLPYLVTAEEASLYSCLPLYEEGMTAIQETRLLFHAEQLDGRFFDNNGIYLGQIFGKSNSLFHMPINYFSKHVLIVGTPRMGKTTIALNLLVQFYQKSVPFLAIEPTKREYRSLIDVIPDLQVFTPGASDVSPFIINPFLPPKGVRLELYKPNLVNAFKAAFLMGGPLEALFRDTVNSCYSKYGWTDQSAVEDCSCTHFGLREFIIEFDHLMHRKGYVGEAKNIAIAGRVRLMDLINLNKSIFDTIHTINIEDLLKKPTIIELNAIENPELKALISMLLLNNIKLYINQNGRNDDRLKNIIMIDEAHVLLDIGGDVNESQPKATQMIKQMVENMIVEMSAYGLGIIIADQTPSRIGSNIIANTDIKLAFRLVDKDQKDFVANAMGMTDAISKENLNRLTKYEAYVFCNLLHSPQIIKIENSRKKYNLPQEVDDNTLKRRMNYWDNRADQLRPYTACDACRYCKSGCNDAVRSKAKMLTDQWLGETGDSIKSIQDFKAFLLTISARLKKICEEDKSEQEHIKQCCIIQSTKWLELEKDLYLKISQ